mgnify:CR=1 FL=1
MGDRANFGFRNRKGDVLFVYGHWAGYEMFAQLANALDNSRSRWGDDGYATRICVSHLVGDEWRSPLSWGLYINEIGDNEHHIPIVDWETQTMGLYEFNWSWNETKIRFVSDTPKFTMPIDEFVNKYQKVSAP